MSEVKNNKKSNVKGKNGTNSKSVSGTNKMKKVSTNRKKQKMQGLEIVRKSLKDSSGFMWGLLVNIIIAFMIVKLFSMSFNFAYDVFSDFAYQPMNEKAVVVEIPADSSVFKIGEALEDAGIIKNKLVFAAKVKIKGYGYILKSGKFGLSPSMTYDEIFRIICDIKVPEEEEEE